MSKEGLQAGARGAATLEARAYEAHRRGDYIRALELYKDLAALGSDFARYNAAKILLYGWGGAPCNPVKARVWFEQVLGGSSSQLRGYAALNLGIIYESGKGTSVNFDKAFAYYKRLEDSNVAEGLLRLGVMYEKGKGTAVDLYKAMEVYRRAAALHNVFARKCLGVLKVRTGEIVSGYFLWGSAILEALFLMAFKRHSQRLRTQ